MRCRKCGTENYKQASVCDNCGAGLPAESHLTETRPLVTPEAPPAERTFPGKYDIIGKIGHGGMGDVYKARDTRLDRTVVLKFLSPTLSRDPHARKQFMTEARAASALDHPNICVIYEIEETEGGDLYISMPYYQGVALREKLDRGRLEVEEAVRVAIRVARGLAKAHAQGIIHRDIKPGNIFITDDGQVKILDFGLAVLGRETDARPGGTILYMSPEQIRGEGIDTRADIWSLGAVIYEMLTGIPPFSGRTIPEVADSVLNEVPQAIRFFNPDTPAELERIVAKAMGKNLDARYERIETLLDDLTSFQREFAAGKPDALPSIAVLPFVDMSPQKDQEYLCDGITEELINGFAKVRNLRVAARTSAFKYKASSLDIREIGQQLAVTTVLEGSVRKADERLRVTAQLIDVKDGYHLWSERYDRDMKDIFAIQDEISERIVEALRVTLTPEERQSIKASGTTDLQAYDYYLRGRKFYYDFRKRTVELAHEMFTLAIKYDPDYALAYAGIADCCAFLFLYSEKSAEVLSKADEASRKALELRADLAEAHVSRGQVLSLSQRHKEAEAEFETALKLGPRLFGAYYLYARDSFAQGKSLKAIQLYEKAAAIAPDDYMSRLLVAQIYDDLGERAKAAATRREGVRIVEGLLRANPGDIRALYMGANGLVALGQVEKGLEWASLALIMDPADSMVLYNCACIFSMTGNVEKALDCLERAADAGLSQREWYEHDSNLDAVRSHPRFKALLERL
jgi:serine/threonine protein kinase/Tfp pilus assembly protein PilF